jgi:hypothetical protein
MPILNPQSFYPRALIHSRLNKKLGKFGVGLHNFGVEIIPVYRQDSKSGHSNPKCSTYTDYAHLKKVLHSRTNQVKH